MSQLKQIQQAEQPFAGHYRYTRIWSNQTGNWQIIGGHCSRCGWLIDKIAPQPFITICTNKRDRVLKEGF